MPQNCRVLEWEETPGEESRREFSNVGPGLDAVDPGKLTLISPAPPQPQGLLTQWGLGMCVFQTLLEEFGWASRGETLNPRQEAKAHGDLPLPQSHLAIMCQAQVHGHRPHQGAEAISQNSLWQVSASPLPECHLCRCPGLSFGKSLDSSELKCPVLQKGGLITSVLRDGVGIRCQSELHKRSAR